MSVRRNTISGWDLSTSKPKTTPLGTGVPNVARFSEQIANIKARGELNAIKIEDGERNRELRRELNQYETASRYADKFSHVASKAYYQHQKNMFEAELRNDNLVATNIVGEYADLLANEALNPNGYMHVAYTPDIDGTGGTSCERSLSELSDSFFSNNESYKNASPRIQEFVKNKAVDIYEKTVVKARVRDAETRFDYMLQTRNRDLQTAFKTSYTNYGLDQWELYLTNKENIPEKDRDMLKRGVANESWLSTIGSSQNPEQYENLGWVFDFENGTYEKPVVRESQEAKTRYEELESTAVSHWCLGGIVSSINTIVRTDDDALANSVFERVTNLLDHKGLTEGDKAVLATNIERAARNRKQYLSERTRNIVHKSLGEGVQAMDILNKSIDKPFEDRMEAVNKYLLGVESNAILIGADDQKLATQYRDAYYTDMAALLVRQVHEQYNKTIDPAYQSVITAAYSGENFGISNAKAETSSIISGALQSATTQLETLRAHPQLAPYVAKAEQNIQQVSAKLEKEYIKKYTQWFKDGMYIDETGRHPVNYQQMAINIERLYNKGIISSEGRAELFGEALKAIKITDDERKFIKQGITQFLGIKESVIDDILEDLGESIDLEGYSSSDLAIALDIIPDKDVKVNIGGKKYKMSKDLIFAIYTLGHEFYSSGDITKDQKTFLDFLKKANETMPEWKEWDNQKRLQASKEMLRQMSAQTNTLWIGNSTIYNWGDIFTNTKNNVK